MRFNLRLDAYQVEQMLTQNAGNNIAEQIMHQLPKAVDNEAMRIQRDAEWLQQRRVNLRRFSELLAKYTLDGEPQ